MSVFNQLDLPPVATRCDARAGTREEISFLPAGGADLFSVTYAPEQGAASGVVICAPIVIEFMTNYRYEVLLARALARSGIAVQRFHYRGSGHSFGDDAATTLPTMVEDVMTATRHVLARTGVARVTFVGSRWGALVAAIAALEFPGSPLVLWDPVVEPSRYFRELFRSRLVREMKDARFGGKGLDAVTRELEQLGWVDVLGYKLHRSLRESAQGIDLVSVLARGRGPVLLVQFGGHRLRPDYAGLDGIGGRSLDVQLIPEEAAWLWAGHRLKFADALVSQTHDWILSTLSPVAEVRR